MIYEGKLKGNKGIQRHPQNVSWSGEIRPLHANQHVRQQVCAFLCFSFSLGTDDMFLINRLLSLSVIVRSGEAKVISLRCNTFSTIFRSVHST